MEQKVRLKVMFHEDQVSLRAKAIKETKLTMLSWFCCPVVQKLSPADKQDEWV